MKKLIIIIFFIINLSNFSNASERPSYIFNPLPDKEGKFENVGLYNLWIRDYNKFKAEFDKEVYDFCANQMIASGGVRQITQESKCIYNAAFDLLEKHNLTITEFTDTLYSYHKNHFALAKTSALSLLDCYSRSCQNKIIDQYVTKWFKLDERLFRDFDFYLDQEASEHQAEYIAKNKQEKDSGLDIGDNEIVPASSGSGFFVSGKGHVVSNHHVIEECEVVKITYQGKEYEAKTLAVDRINDLAILKTNVKPTKIFPISQEDPQLLEQVIVAGFPLGKKISQSIKASTGTVTALAGLGDNYSEFQTDAALNSGNSGGPIINNYGNVVGVAVSKIQSEGIEGFNFGVKSSTLKTFASANGLKFLPPNKNEMKKKNLGSLITDSTVYIDCWMSGKKLKELLSKNKNSQKAIYSKYKN